MAATGPLNKREEELRMGQLLAGSPSNYWGRWGPNDQVGSLNFLTNAEVLRGVRAVKQGKVFTCGEQIGQLAGDPIWPGRAPTSRVNVRDKSHYDAGRVKPLPSAASSTPTTR